VLRILQEKLVALYVEGKQVVVLIDEAHAMPKETLEEIRLLSNLESSRHKLLQLVLFGQPEINDTLARPDMRQLRERITHNFNLEPLVRDDIAQYLDFRMRAAGYRGPSVFTPAAIKLIAEVSQGLTRRINILADKALLACFAAGSHQVGPKEVRAAIQDSEFAATRGSGMIPFRLPAATLWAGGGALAMLALGGAWRLLAEPTPPPAATSSAVAMPAATANLAPAPAPAPNQAEPPPVQPAAERPAPPAMEQQSPPAGTARNTLGPGRRRCPYGAARRNRTATHAAAGQAARQQQALAGNGAAAALVHPALHHRWRAPRTSRSLPPARPQGGRGNGPGPRLPFAAERDGALRRHLWGLCFAPGCR
jgi:hypothetical protein